MPRKTTAPPGLRRILALAASSLLLSLASAGGDFVAPASAAGGAALRFYGTGAEELDRVMIPLGPISNGQLTGSFPVNVAGDFTLEFWMKAAAAANAAPACSSGWYYGNIIVDRDVDGAGDEGDYGVALCDGRIAFGVSVGEDDRQLVSAVPVTDDQWHHIALTRADGGQIAIYVDGQPAGSAAGPSGSVAYRLNRETARPSSDPYLVLGAEKHGYPGTFHYDGLLDDLRISGLVRYTGAFGRPTAPHEADGATVALYRFDEGAGIAVADSSGAPGGPSDGALIVAETTASPAWVTDTPFTGVVAPEATATDAAAAPTGAAGTPLPVEPTAAASAVAVEPTVAASAVAVEPTGPAATATRAAVIPLPAVTFTPEPRMTATAPPVVVIPAPTAATATETRAAAGAAAPTTVGDGRAPADAPPPGDDMYTVLFAWLAAAAVVVLAIVAGLRWRARG